MAELGIRDAVIGDAEAVGKLVTELGYPTAPGAMRDRLASILTDPGYHRGEAHVFYERHGYSRTGFRFVKPLNAAQGKLFGAG